MGSGGKPRIYLTVGTLPADLLAKLEGECEVVRREGGRQGEEEFRAALRGMDGILCGAPERIPAECLEAYAGRLKVVSNFGVGYDNVDLELATKHGVMVCNTPGVLNDAVADLTLGLILALTRRISSADRWVRQGEWGRSGFPLGWDLRGKVLGIVGMGRIGRAVAARAEPFGVKVIACDVASCEPYEGCELEELLARADIVSIHTNLSPETRGLIGEAELRLMKPSAVLVNTARGPIVDWGALRRALVEGWIAGAAVDVTDPEPPAADDVLLQLPNVIVTPHIASATVETRRAMAELAVANLLEGLAGRRPPHLVNTGAWRG